MGIKEALGLKESYYDQREEELRELDKEYKIARERARQSAGEEKARYEKDLSEYETHRRGIEAQLSDLKNAGEDTWEDMKTGVEKGWAEVKNSYNKLKNRLT